MKYTSISKYKPYALPDQRSQGPVNIRPEITNLTKHKSRKLKNTTNTRCNI